MPAEPTPLPLTAERLRRGEPPSLTALLGGEQQAAAALRTLAARWWQTFQTRSDLHPALIEVLAPLGKPLAEAFANESALSRPDHPCWGWLRLLHSAGIGFHPELGRGGERVLAELGSHAAQVAGEGWQAAYQSLTLHQLRETERLDKLEQRLEASERGQWQARQAQQLAARQLNRSMGGRPLPAAAVEFLQGVWYQELQWCLLTHGEQSDEWQRRASLTDALVASLQPPADDDARQPLYALIAEIGPQLRELLYQRSHDPSALDRQLAAIEQQHLRLLRGEAPESATYQLIDNRELWPEAVALSSELLVPLQQLREGDWLLETSGGRRLKLARRLEPWQQLLLVNRLGARAELLDVESAAFRLAIGDLRPLAGAHCVEQVTEELLQQLIDHLRLQQKRRAEAQRLAEARERAEQQLREEAETAAREQARQKALAEAAAAAARQAEADAQRAAAERQRLDDEQRQREARQLQQAQAKLQAEQEHQQRQLAREQEQARRLRVTAAAGDDQRRREARRAVSLLAVGDWLELRDEFGDSQRLKLAVKLPSSGRLLLVDREGIKRADLTGDELVEQLATGAATLLANAPRFEDTLARVVDGLRRDRGPRE
jgi:hypothetical protein